jgi:multiple sugar transport system substrate-binding protein
MSKYFNRRNFLKLAAFSVAGTVLASCAPATPPATQAPANQATVVSKPAANGQKTTLRVVSGNDVTEIEIRTQVAKMFGIVRPDVDVQMDIVSGDRAQSQLTMIAGGSPPDVLYLNDYFQYTFASKGLLVDLNPYIAKDKFDWSPYLKEAVDANVYKTQMTGMPFEVATIGVVYNKKLFDDAKLPYPTADVSDTSWNWDALIEVAGKLTDTTKNQYGFAMDSWMIPNWVESYDQRYLSNNKEITADTHSVINNPKTVEAFQFWVDLAEKYKVSPSAALSQEIAGFDRFMSGKVAMYPYGRWLNTFRQIRDFEWDVTPLPAPKDGHQASVLYNLNYGIYSKSKQMDLSWEFLKFILTEPPQTVNVLAGMAVSAMTSVNNSSDFLNNAPPAHNKVYADYMAVAKLWDSNEIDYMQYANQTLSDLFSGKRTDVAGVLKDASDGIDRALNEYRTQNK